MTKQLMANKRKALRAVPGKRLSKLTSHLKSQVAKNAKDQARIKALMQASDTDLASALVVLTRNELKEICEALGLPSTARKKADLADVIVGSWAGAEPSGTPSEAKPAEASAAEPSAAASSAKPAETKSAAPGKGEKDAGASQAAKAKTPAAKPQPDADERAQQLERAQEREQEREIREPGWAHIEASSLASLDRPDFTRLCHELLAIETHERHATSTLLERAPAGSSHVGDLRCMVTERPWMPAADYALRWAVAPLVGDIPGVTVFRVKSGASWHQDAIAEIDENDWALKVLQAGGRMVVLTNASRRRRDEKTPVERKLAEAYAALMLDRDPDIEDLEERITIIPAEDLALLIRSRRPLELSLESRDLLGVTRIPNLIDFQTWAWAHLPDGGVPLLAPPPFEWDARRCEVRDQLVRMLNAPSEDPFSHVAWLDGPYGVGKTRLLLETLRSHPELRLRTLIAPNLDAAIAALSAHRLFEQYPTALLIIDECPARGLIQLIPWLERYNHRGIGGLIAMTVSNPGDDPHVPAVFHRCRLNLHALEQGAHRRLLAREMGAADDSLEVSQVVELTEGAPWLAALVAREVAAGAPLPETPTEAVELAIASHDEADREAQLDLRIRVLLLMMLIGDLDWNTLTRADRRSLCRAVGVANFQDVEDGRRVCLERGLLRKHMGPHPERVTPVIVAREVAKKMLQPSISGPAPQAGPLGEHARKLLPALYRRLEPLGLDRLVAVQLAAPIARALEFDAPGVAVVGESGVGRAELVFATRYQMPQRIARVLGRRIEDTPLEILEERVDIRSALVEAMECLAGRKWSFERAENALFRLALAENQSVSNNATNTWANLFAVEGNQTYRSFAVRLSLLQKRVSSGDTKSRLVALEGVRAALSVDRFITPGDALDGTYPQVTQQEALPSRTAAWKLLLQQMGGSEQAIAKRAGEIAVECLSGTIPTKLDKEIAMELGDVGPLLPESTQRHLRHGVICLQNDLRRRRKRPAEEWNQLLKILEPRTYKRLLYDRVGTWPSDGHDQEEQDCALARKGLEGDNPVLDELPWIVTEEAVRRLSFALALGLEDVERVVLDKLVDLVRAGSGADVLASYLLGWHNSDGEKEVAKVLRALRIDSALSDAVALTIWHLGATDKNVALLLELLDRGTLPNQTMWVFTTGSWAKGLSQKSLTRLSKIFLDRGTREDSELAYTLIVQALGDDAASKKKWRTMLETALRSATDATEPLGTYWQRTALLLVGADVDIAELVLGVAMEPDQTTDNHAAWSVFGALSQRNPKHAWKILVDMCDQADAGTARRVAHTLGYRDLVGCFDTAMVMDWVGDDSRRANWITRMLHMHQTDAMPALARELIARFGESSECALRLQKAASRPPHNVATDLADFHGMQIARARQWSEDEVPAVKTWALSLIDVLEKHLQNRPS